MRPFLLSLLILSLPAAAWSEVTANQARNYGRQLQAFIQGQRAGAINDLIEEIGRLDDPKVAIYLPAAAVGLPSAGNYTAAVRVMSELKSPASVEALAKVVGRGRGDVRHSVAIVEAFGRRSDEASLQVIVEQLKSKLPQVRLVAVQAARARKAKEVVPGLLDTLEEHWKLRDRLWLEALEALVSMTGQSFETIADWRKYWESVRETFDPSAVEKKEAKEGEEEGEKGEGRSGTDVRLKTVEESVQFFGSEIFSRNIIFVIDVSGSMLMYDRSDSYKGNNMEQDRQRLHRARQQLVQAVKKLPRGAFFNIITFSNKVTSWQKRMQAASPQTVASAVKFVEAFSATGATHTDEALELAFADMGVDTIVLLSDGAPMKTALDDYIRLIPKIIERVKDLNAWRKVKLETFGFDGSGTWPERTPQYPPPRGPPPPPGPEECKKLVEFLKTLARDSGGTYRSID
jgi:hypothetical protein